MGDREYKGFVEFREAFQSITEPEGGLGDPRTLQWVRTYLSKYVSHGEHLPFYR